jgi:hypothetical protein
MATESQLVTACLKWCKLRGILAWRNMSVPVPGRTFRGTRGVADILGVCPGGKGRLLAIECKTGEGKLRPEQEVWLREASAAGALVLIVRDVADLEKIAEPMGW